MNNLYDKEFRNKIKADPKKAFMNNDNFEYKVLTSTKDITYFVMPYLQDSDLSSLKEVVAADTLGSAGTVGTVGTAGSVSSLTPSSFVGSASSVSTAGSALSVGTAVSK